MQRTRKFPWYHLYWVSADSNKSSAVTGAAVFPYFSLQESRSERYSHLGQPLPCTDRQLSGVACGMLLDFVSALSYCRHFSTFNRKSQELFFMRHRFTAYPFIVANATCVPSSSASSTV